MNRVHRPRFYIHQGSMRNKSATCGFIIIHGDVVQLQVIIGSRGVAAMLITDYLPELGTDLVATLTCLHEQELPHG